MLIRITTDNGYMVVDLEKFLLNSRARTKKLFKLMRTGVPQSSRKEIRCYLEERQRAIEQGTVKLSARAKKSALQWVSDFDAICGNVSR